MLVGNSGVFFSSAVGGKGLSVRYVYFVDVFRSFPKLADLGGMMKNDRSY